MSKKETLFGAHLPTDFVEKVKKYAEKTNIKTGGIDKFTHRTFLYNALSEYMKNHPV